MIKNITFLTLVTLTMIPATGKEAFFKDNEAIKSLDCVDFGLIKAGIEGRTVHDILCLANDLRVLQVGNVDKDKNIVRHYKVANEFCTLHELVKWEEALDQKLALQQEALIKQYGKDTPAFEGAWKQAQAEHHQQHAQMLATLNVIKDDFLKKTESFVQQINMFKEFICDLIDDWCVRRERTDSHLSKWGTMKKNEEHKFFREELKTCKQTDVFFTDLKIFLMDLVLSCPKAMQDYKEHYAGKKH